MVTWTDEAIERLYAGAKAGERAATIAAALGLRPRDVEAKAERLRIKWVVPEAAAVAPEAGAERRADVVAAPVAPRPARVARAGSEWDEARERRLRDLARTGHSAREIAEALGATKNAVIGKAARMMVKLTGRSKPVSRRPVVDPGAPDISLSVLFLERVRGQCAVILDDAAPILERRCCGAPVSGERYAFCAHHRLRYTIESGRAAA